RFGVENRTELARRASGFLHPAVGGMNAELASEGSGRGLGPVAVERTPIQITAKHRGAAFARRALTA
ncbi:MAG TPA: hypothetical protein VMF66_04210, partial [Candidatus Acidoferrum sp.]|nr:hypothetical protein [Candidatus Acidoferrum sp.]